VIKSTVKHQYTYRGRHQIVRCG